MLSGLRRRPAPLLAFFCRALERAGFFGGRDSARAFFRGAPPVSAFRLARSASIRLTTFDRAGCFGLGDGWFSVTPAVTGGADYSAEQPAPLLTRDGERAVENRSKKFLPPPCACICLDPHHGPAPRGVSIRSRGNRHFTSRWRADGPARPFRDLRARCRRSKNCRRAQSRHALAITSRRPRLPWQARRSAVTAGGKQGGPLESSGAAVLRSATVRQRPRLKGPQQAAGCTRRNLLPPRISDFNTLCWRRS